MFFTATSSSVHFQDCGKNEEASSRAGNKRKQLSVEGYTKWCIENNTYNFFGHFLDAHTCRSIRNAETNLRIYLTMASPQFRNVVYYFRYFCVENIPSCLTYSIFKKLYKQNIMCKVNLPQIPTLPSQPLQQVRLVQTARLALLNLRIENFIFLGLGSCLAVSRSQSSSDTVPQAGKGMSRNHAQKISYLLACHATLLELRVAWQREKRRVATKEAEDTDSAKIE